MDIFDYHAQKAAASSMPLAERMRPRHLDEFVGQHKAVGEGSLIRHAIETDRVFSMILWGVPGCGKTTLARLIAAHANMDAYYLSAISAGVADVRKIITKGQNNKALGGRTLLFIDESSILCSSILNPANSNSNLISSMVILNSFYLL